MCAMDQPRSEHCSTPHMGIGAQYIAASRSKRQSDAEYCLQVPARMGAQEGPIKRLRVVPQKHS